MGNAARMKALTELGEQRGFTWREEAIELQNDLVLPKFRFAGSKTKTKTTNYHNVKGLGIEGTGGSREPGSFAIGDLVNAYRSEHYLADAQATNDQGILSKKEGQQGKMKVRRKRGDRATKTQRM